MQSIRDDIADPILYRLYYGLMLPDIAKKIGLPATPYVKKRLHEIHKKYLKYRTTANASQKVMSLFLFEVCALWGCHGIFVKTKMDQPDNIEDLPLSEVWKYL